MQLYTVWRKPCFSTSNEKCLKNTDGNFVNINTGQIFERDKHYASIQYKAKIIAVDLENLTGMLHLSDGFKNQEANKANWKQNFIGCFVTVEKAHFYGGTQIYRCLELNEYFSSNEIEIEREV